ncbi:MAG: GGDEF domain-containing protein [Spirochaetota bacterium]
MSKNKIQFLKRVIIFNSFSEQELKKIEECLIPVTIEKNEKLFSEGDEGNEFYIVESGVISSSINCTDGSQKEIALFKSGDCFGEMSIFENAPRSASCYSKEDSSLYKFRKTDFFKLLESEPDFAIRIMYKILNITTQRLRNTGNFLSDMVRWGNDASKRAVTDELTGIYNRRYLDSALEDYFLTAKAAGKPLSLIMIDLDYFREINNQYKHETGDKAIIEIVRASQKHLRELDSMARYGGDEFTIILRDTDQGAAFAIAEKIRIEVANVDLLKNSGGSMTNLSLSMGLASFPKNADTLKELRAKADQALYKAKENGRNRVCCAD